MKYILIFSAALFFSVSKAQLPIGAIAPNFTATDIHGNSHTLYDYLDQGYKVLLDISATWCPPCWSYHNSGVMTSVYNQHGPQGDQTAMVFLVEGDAQTTLADLYGTGPNTLGNWVSNSPYPIIESSSIADLYAITGYPTTYLICANRTIIRSDVGNSPSLNTVNNYFSMPQCQSLFSCSAQSSTTTIKVEMTTDNFPQDVTWKIKNESNQIVANGGPYGTGSGAQTPVNVLETRELPGTGCYSFHLYDVYGDGMHAAQWQPQYTNGYCKVYGINSSGENMSPFFYYNGSYNFIENIGFMSVQVLDVEENSLLSNLSIYPNPNRGNAQLSFSLTYPGEVSFTLINSVGQTVRKHDFGSQGIGHHSLSLDLSDLGSGVYLANLMVGGQVIVSRIAVEK